MRRRINMVGTLALGPHARQNGWTVRKKEKHSASSQLQHFGPGSSVSLALKGPQLEGATGGSLIRMERGVLGDADHGEDFLEVGAEAEGVEGLAALAGGDHHLDDQGDAGGVG